MNVLQVLISRCYQCHPCECNKVIKYKSHNMSYRFVAVDIGLTLPIPSIVLIPVRVVQAHA